MRHGETIPAFTVTNTKDVCGGCWGSEKGRNAGNTFERSKNSRYVPLFTTENPGGISGNSKQGETKCPPTPKLLSVKQSGKCRKT